MAALFYCIYHNTRSFPKPIQKQITVSMVGVLDIIGFGVLFSPAAAFGD